jgi:hypothetical protein
MARMMPDIDAGRPGAGTVDNRPWQWLAAVSSAARERGQESLAGRIGQAAAVWREHWEAQIPRMAPGRSLNQGSWPTEVNIQFSEEIGLFPPPDDSYAIILASAVRALSYFYHAPIIVRNNTTPHKDAWPAEEVILTVSEALIALVGAEPRGTDLDALVDPLDRALALTAIAADRRVPS